MTSQTIFCIANPNAAQGKIRSQVDSIQSFFESNNAVSEFIWTTHPRHAIEIARDLSLSGKSIICSVGGDGTAFEVINGVMLSGEAANIKLGIIPMGTGNSFLRDFGIRTWQQAVKRIVAGETHPVDIGCVNILKPESEKPVYFHNMLGFGLIANACKLRHTHFSWLGKYAYHGAFLKLLFGIKSYKMKLRSEETGSLTIESPLSAVCNSQYTGYEMHLSPQSMVDDGYFDLIYSKDISAWQLLNLFISLPQGKHLEHPKAVFDKIKYFELSVDSINYFMIDGEILAGSHFKVEMLPAALNVLV